jgi:hypothetical protein
LGLIAQGRHHSGPARLGGSQERQGAPRRLVHLVGRRVRSRRINGHRRIGPGFWSEAQRERPGLRDRVRSCIRPVMQPFDMAAGSIDEGVDCLAADGPQPRFVATFQPTGDLFGRPSLGEPIPPRTDVKRLLVRGSRHAACAIDRLRRRAAANTRPRGVRSAQAPWR